MYHQEYHTPYILLIDYLVWKVQNRLPDYCHTYHANFTLLSLESGPRKAGVLQEQIVTDSRGRQRFHGAFTGGFSAGFYNTVGSKEGE